MEVEASPPSKGTRILTFVAASIDLAGVGVIPDAGHYVFLAPCSPQLAKEAADICRDPPGVDRVEAHERIDADALAFFEKTLIHDIRH